MVKTTITLEDTLYKRLVKEALDKYGRTRGLSRLINEKLSAEIPANRAVANKVEKSFGSWMLKETGAEYVRKLRRQSEQRLRRMAI